MKSLIELSDALEALVAQVSPAVVGVGRGRGQGTGVVIAQDGYVLTNHHVAGSGRGTRVSLFGGERIPARLVGSDPSTDLAVLKVEGPRLVSLPLAEKKAPAVGQWVVAIGNPLGFERSVSMGIISQVDRTLPGPQGSPFEGLLQTDAAINPGNSGGPLVNARGEAVGINTAVIPYAQGMGFAINARTAAWVASVLIQHGEVRRRFLGIAARSVDLGTSLALEVGQARAIHVLDVVAGSPAERAGLRAQDYLVAVQGQPTASVDDLHRVLVLHGADEVELEVHRKGSRVKLAITPSRQQQAA